MSSTAPPGSISTSVVQALSAAALTPPAPSCFGPQNVWGILNTLYTTTTDVDGLPKTPASTVTHFFLGPIPTSDGCYPSGFSANNDIGYPAAQCPESYTAATTTKAGGVSNAETTMQVCCPTAYSFSVSSSISVGSSSWASYRCVTDLQDSTMTQILTHWKGNGDVRTTTGPVDKLSAYGIVIRYEEAPTSSTSEPSSSNSPTPTSTTAAPTGLSTSAKAGIGVGVTIAVFAMLGLILWVVMRRRRQNPKLLSGSDSDVAELNGYTVRQEMMDTDMQEMMGLEMAHEVPVQEYPQELAGVEVRRSTSRI